MPEEALRGGWAARSQERLPGTACCAPTAKNRSDASGRYEKRRGDYRCGAESGEGWAGALSVEGGGVSGVGCAGWSEKFRPRAAFASTLR